MEELPQPTTNIKWIAFVVVLLVLVAVFSMAYLIPSKDDDDKDTITLYGFSVKGEVCNDEIFPAFREYWKTETGKNMDFKSHYAGSGTITKQVLTGVPAEVMILSTEWDALQLKENGFVDTDWNGYPYNGTVSKSPWVILVRDGNPKNITDFPDLGRGGVEIVHADPLTSGGACWSIFAVYGSALKRSELNEGIKDHEYAGSYLKEILDNVICWQSSARKALTYFIGGFGDAIITYENEALFALEQGEAVEIVYPQSTIFSEHKAVIVDENINFDEKELIEEFVNFLFTDEVQESFVEHGFRSVNDDINNLHPEFPVISAPFTVSYLGGWVKAHEELIEGVYKDIRD